MTSAIADRTLQAFSSLACLLSCLALTACQSPAVNNFGDVKQGMEKDQVLEATKSGPTKALRWQGKDRWIYEYKLGDEPAQVKEVHFEEGKAVYVGDKVVPKLTAAERDRLNEESNLKEEQRIEEENLARERFLGAARTQVHSSTRAKSPNGNSFDDDDRRLRESMYGPSDPSLEKTKHAPNFELID